MWWSMVKQLSSCSRCICAHCTESGRIGHINGRCTGWWGHRSILILLCYHASLDSQNFFWPEPKTNMKKPKVWNIKAVKEQLGPEICSNIFFLHAVLGCDTTSHLYGIGKGSFLRKFKLSWHFREQAKVLATESATPKEISTAGKQR